MEIMWSPWRSKYINSFKDEENNCKEKPCFFCEAINHPENDAENLVVARGNHCFAMLNRYPYNSGHILIAPYRHIGEIELLTDDELIAITFMTRQVIKIIQEVNNPHGFNIGANIGRVAGAGVPGHFHFHVVPRWSGDTSFMPVLSDIHVVSVALEDLQKTISEEFKKYSL